MPDVSGASAVNTRVHTPTTKRTRGCWCIGHPAFPAPSDLQMAGNSRSNLAQTCGEIAKLCSPSLRGAKAMKQSILSSAWLAWIALPSLSPGAPSPAPWARNDADRRCRVLRRRVGKGALAPCPPSIGNLILNGGHAALCPPYALIVIIREGG